MQQTDDFLMENMEYTEVFSKLGPSTSQGVINLGPLPQFGWGEIIQITLHVSQNNKPSSKVRVVLWFSGQHEWKTKTYPKTTDSQGQVTFLLTVNKQWKNKTKWLDLNAAVPALIAKKHWRIK